MPSHTSESPAKKQTKWSPEEDALIIELRGSGMKWDDISKRLPGRSSISCRLHYQNYLERRSEWDEERKNKLARLYERFKPEMWAKVAEEMQVPWRAAEAMHWQLGPQRISPTRGHAHSQSQGSLPRDFTGGLPSPRYTRGAPPPPPLPPPPPSHPQIPPLIPPPTPRSVLSRRESLPPRPSFGPPLLPDLPHQQPDYGYGLAPIQSLPHPAARGSSGPSLLPGVAELTTGISPYSTPAYTLGGSHLGPPQGPSPRGGSTSTSASTATTMMMVPTATAAAAASPRLLPSLSPYPGSHRQFQQHPQQQQQQQQQQQFEPPGIKRRASPPDGRETTRRRGGAYPPPRALGQEDVGRAGDGVGVSENGSGRGGYHQTVGSLGMMGPGPGSVAGAGAGSGGGGGGGLPARRAMGGRHG